MGRAGVTGVYCVHGTFAGGDPLGLLAELARVAPSLSGALTRLGKRLVDLVMGETGNYTAKYAQAMETHLSKGAGRSIPVRRFHWSSQNNHIGRADGAIRLLVELAELASHLDGACASGDLPPRVLLWGHSHAGNLFALLSNLLAAEQRERRVFFQAARCSYRSTLFGHVDMPAWTRAEQVLDDADHPIHRLTLDVVTFGTPIRYAWAEDRLGGLLHFVNHRPVPSQPEYLGPQTVKFLRMLTAADGDSVQQIGIAGSNFMPIPLAVRTLAADRRLGRLIEHSLSRERLLGRIAYGMRVAESGTTLLVDYPKTEWGVHRHLMGHAVYTRRRWLPFHLEQVARCLYA